MKAEAIHVGVARAGHAVAAKRRPQAIRADVEAALAVAVANKRISK